MVVRIILNLYPVHLPKAAMFHKQYRVSELFTFPLVRPFIRHLESLYIAARVN